MSSFQANKHLDRALSMATKITPVLFLGASYYNSKFLILHDVDS